LSVCLGLIGCLLSSHGLRRHDVQRGGKYSRNNQEERKMIKLLGILLSFLATTSTAHATTIDFSDGLTTIHQPGGAAVGGYYSGLGVYMPNLRFHDSTHSGNVPFNFTDGWGAVVDYGVFKENVGYIHFVEPINYIHIDGMAQSSFGLNGAEPYSWSMLAYDVNNNLVGAAMENYGFDFAGSPNPPNADPYPLALVSLRIDALNLMSRVEVYPGGKVGFDTISFGVSQVPLPGTLSLMLSGFISLGFVIRNRMAVNEAINGPGSN